MKGRVPYTETFSYHYVTVAERIISRLVLRFASTQRWAWVWGRNQVIKSIFNFENVEHK